jgi:hypothetical protein
VTVQESSRRRPGRPERPLDPGDGPLPSFAYQLRQLRAAAGYPTYRNLARTALFSPSVLSTAANGLSFPSLQVTLAFAAACGADTGEWRRRWEAAGKALAAPPGSAAAQPRCTKRMPRTAGWPHGRRRAGPVPRCTRRVS